MAKITAPVKDFTGKRGQVAFSDGVAECDDPSMIAYFRRHGYKVTGTAKGKGAEPKEPASEATEEPSEQDEPKEPAKKSTASRSSSK